MGKFDQTIIHTFANQDCSYEKLYILISNEEATPQIMCYWTIKKCVFCAFMFLPNFMHTLLYCSFVYIYKFPRPWKTIWSTVSLLFMRGRGCLVSGTDGRFKKLKNWLTNRPTDHQNDHSVAFSLSWRVKNHESSSDTKLAHKTNLKNKCSNRRPLKSINEWINWETAICKNESAETKATSEVIITINFVNGLRIYALWSGGRWWPIPGRVRVP